VSTTIAPHRASTATIDLRFVLTSAAGWLAAASGLIHFVVIRDHLEYPVIAVAFGVMGIAQWGFAVGALTAISRRGLLLGAMLHAAIAVTWVLSRTTGLRIVAGSSGAEPVGVADVVSTTFCLGVIGAVAINQALDRLPVLPLPVAAARRITAVTLAGVLFLTVPAILTPHEHDHASEPVTTPAAPGVSHHDHSDGEPAHP
jgi:hypothetical protein